MSSSDNIDSLRASTEQSSPDVFLGHVCDEFRGRNFWKRVWQCDQWWPLHQYRHYLRSRQSFQQLGQFLEKEHVPTQIFKIMRGWHVEYLTGLGSSPYIDCLWYTIIEMQKTPALHSPNKNRIKTDPLAWIDSLCTPLLIWPNKQATGTSLYEPLVKEKAWQSAYFFMSR